MFKKLSMKKEQKENECKHYGTMTLTPTEEEGWKVLEWCYYQDKQINGNCPRDCCYKDKPLQSWEL